MNNLLFFSNNENKKKEVENLFKKLKYKILSPRDMSLIFEPNEIGKSFIDNAKIKSSYGFNKFNIPCFADDSGICIEALNWKPNINSKNFLGSFKNKNDCFNYILKKVNKTKKNKAYFITSICLTLNKKHHIIFQGRLDGTISNKAMGQRGFGFDPIFKPFKFTKTLGEMSKEEKNKISHRSIAINKLINFLTN